MQVTSDVAGTVWEVSVAEGASVSADDPVIVLESMKMEIPITAPCAGTVVKLLVKKGDLVTEGQAVAQLASL
jgi:acetyl-CoA carboxylase biotin carboxyl carrier protein